MALRAFWKLLFIVGFPVGSYLALRGGLEPVWLGAGDFILVLVALSAMVLDVRSPTFPRKLMRVATAGLMIMAALWYWSPDYLGYLPYLAINAGLALLFLTTLKPQREPLITRFAKLERGGVLPPELAVYTRRLTWLWAVFFGLLVVESLVLMQTASVETYLMFANTYNYGLVGAFMVLEYIYRRIRYRRYSHVSPLGFLRVLIKASVLEAGKQH